MLTCIIRYHIDPTKKAQFEQYARNWGQAIPRNGADLIGYYAPHEGSATLAYGIYNIPSLAAYEAYRERLAWLRDVFRMSGEKSEPRVGLVILGFSALFLAITFASVACETPGPPASFGTLIDQRPLCE